MKCQVLKALREFEIAAVKARASRDFILGISNAIQHVQGIKCPAKRKAVK